MSFWSLVFGVMLGDLAFLGALTLAVAIVLGMWHAWQRALQAWNDDLDD